MAKIYIKTKFKGDDMSEQSVKNHAYLIWNIAETLRGTYKAGDYGKVVLPFVVLRRLDAVLESTRAEAVKTYEEQIAEGFEEDHLMPWMREVTGRPVYNRHPESLRQIANKGPEQVRDALISYVFAFDPAVREIFHEKFEFDKVLNKLHSSKLLYGVLKQFVAADLHPDRVSNDEMGAIFEELLRKFSEMSNETAGEHYTPRDALYLLADLIIVGDTEFMKKGIVRKAYDPTAGTGGILSVLQERALLHNSTASIKLYGQELNGESFAICKSDLLLKGQDAENIKNGNTLTDDLLEGQEMHWIGANPPYGVEWKAYADVIREEHERLGFSGRYGAGMPRVSDGQLLFIQHIIYKLRGDVGRVAVVTNGSPLFTGGAGSGESEIRRWLIENDLLDTIVALPSDMFYNTGIQTYIWVIDKHKPAQRRGKVQLIDASGEIFYKPMRKVLGSKRRVLTEEGRQRVLNAYLSMEESGISKVFDGEAFGFREIRVERPLRLQYRATAETVESVKGLKIFSKMTDDQIQNITDDLFGNLVSGEDTTKAEIERVFAAAYELHVGKKAGTADKRAVVAHFSVRDEDSEPVLDAKGNPEPDPELRDTEIVPLNESIDDYMEREVLPFLADAWADESGIDSKDGGIGKVGYEINFNRYFYRWAPSRALSEIDTDLKYLEREITQLLEEVVA